MVEIAPAQAARRRVALGSMKNGASR